MFRWKAVEGKPLENLFNLTSIQNPTCGQANEFLVEDRIFNYQIKLKEEIDYTVVYLPDAKSFEDVPSTFTHLLKQRRRWHNGSIFQGLNMLYNFFHLISCRRKIQPWYGRCHFVFLLTINLYYYLLNFIHIALIFFFMVFYYPDFTMNVLGVQNYVSVEE